MTQKKQHIFNFNHVSEVDEITYSGTFSCKKLSIRDYAQLSVIKAKLNGGMYHVPNQPGIGIDEGTDNLNHMIAHLELGLVNTPDWWNLDELGDVEVVTKVFTEVAKFENSFRKRKNADGDSEGRSPQDNPEAHSGGDAAQVVGEEVQDSLEP